MATHYALELQNDRLKRQRQDLFARAEIAARYHHFDKMLIYGGVLVGKKILAGYVKLQLRFEERQGTDPTIAPLQVADADVSSSLEVLSATISTEHEPLVADIETVVIREQTAVYG